MCGAKATNDHVHGGVCCSEIGWRKENGGTALSCENNSKHGLHTEHIQTVEHHCLELDSTATQGRSGLLILNNRPVLR